MVNGRRGNLSDHSVVTDAPVPLKRLACQVKQNIGAFNAVLQIPIVTVVADNADERIAYFVQGGLELLDAFKQIDHDWRPILNVHVGAVLLDASL
jgi:hypothetical protein